MSASMMVERSCPTCGEDEADGITSGMTHMNTFSGHVKEFLTFNWRERVLLARLWR